MSYTLPELPYAHTALEPHFDTETMTIHHQRHHQAYVDNLNKALAGTEGEQKELEDILKEISKYTAAVRNNAGGHYNHSLFWKTLSPNAKLAPEGKLAEEINKAFGGLEELKAQIKQNGLGQFGSGWAWLLVKHNGTLGVSATANQDNPLMDTNLTSKGYPILGVDVWEHAYYLKFQNKRADYLDAFWSVLDWSAVEKNYEAALAKIG
ncbi:superoxide dismutase [Marinilongibacter aquaticus]|uniref:superoxide dismutase n=1 Tax=Marinilongibacter aquaticus TaxID=2975157 RepID=UPI0021BD99B9|nr:superoxide dismutase [Marinilongibacter aquaticus]UBM59504.1 superoxide dismutase [Marinilongibacter aquaticus]